MSRLHDAARTEARTIEVSVILSAGLRRLLPESPDGPQRHTVAAGATLAHLLAALGIAPSTDLTAAVDGELAERDAPLRDGAEVMLLVPMEGGGAAEGEPTIRNAVKSREGGGAAEGEPTIRNAVKSREGGGAAEGEPTIRNAVKSREGGGAAEGEPTIRSAVKGRGSRR